MCELVRAALLDLACNADKRGQMALFELENEEKIGAYAQVLHATALHAIQLSTGAAEKKGEMPPSAQE